MKKVEITAYGARQQGGRNGKVVVLPNGFR